MAALIALGLGTAGAQATRTPVSSAARAGSLRGTIYIAATCVLPLGRTRLCSGHIRAPARGYVPSLSAVVGAPTGRDSSVLQFLKTSRHLVEGHGWGVRILPREVTINRSKASISVKHPIGRHGADGQINFTLRGRPHVQTDSCGGRSDVLHGSLHGTIRLRVHDHFFRTITITRMRAEATDTYTGQGCSSVPLPRCTSGSFLSGYTSFPGNRPQFTLVAERPRKSRSALTVDVGGGMTGTPFTTISHSIEWIGPGSLVTIGPGLTSATVRTPGGTFSGSLRAQASGTRTTFSESCQGGHEQTTFQPARVTSGHITARFDSIGKVTVGTNLTGGVSLEQMTRVP